MGMDEALAWLKGERSMANIIPQEPFATWQVRIAQADAAMMFEAYLVARAHHDDLLSWSKGDCR